MCYKDENVHKECNSLLGYATALIHIFKEMPDLIDFTKSTVGVILLNSNTHKRIQDEIKKPDDSINLASEWSRRKAKKEKKNSDMGHLCSDIAWRCIFMHNYHCA